MNTKTIFDKAYLNFSNEITSTTSRGDPFTAYTGQGPVRFLGQLSDAAINKFYFLDAVEEVEVPQGTPQVVVRKRKVYPCATTSWLCSSEPIRFKYVKLRYRHAWVSYYNSSTSL